MKKTTILEAIGALSAVQQGNGVAVMNGRKVRNKVVYIAGLGTTLSTNNNQLVLPSTDKAVGITNLDSGNKLNSGRSLLVTGVRMLFDTTADVTPLTAGWKSEAPAVFKNGELQISQQGSGDLFNSPIGPICKYNAAIATEDEFTAVVPFLLRPEVPFEIKALLAGATAANQAYRLELDCIEFVDGDKA